jgi:hypothetical protein
VKRLPVFCVLLALALPGAAAARTGAPNDGSLLVKGGNGKIWIQAKGGVIGHFTDGVLTVRDFNPDDNVNEVVTGAERSHVVSDQVTKYWGSDVRFRYIGGKFTITVAGFGINLSAIGKGFVTLQGNKGTDDDGTFSLNGAAAQPITDVQQIFSLGTTG